MKLAFHFIILHVLRLRKHNSIPGMTSELCLDRFDFDGIDMSQNSWDRSVFTTVHLFFI